MKQVSIQKIQEIFTDTIGPIDITPNTSMRNTPEWDSFSHMDFIQSLEEHFDITFTLEELTTLTSIEQLINILREK